MPTKYKNILKAQKDVFQKCYNSVSNPNLTKHQNLQNTINTLARSIGSYSNTEYSKEASLSAIWLKAIIDDMNGKLTHFFIRDNSLVDFLKETTKNLLNKQEFTYDLKGKDVVILGGGDTGNDCVATAVRLGAKSVTSIEITKEPPLTNTVPWPEYPNAKKTDYGIEEASYVAGKDIRLYETTVDEILGEEKVESLVIKNVEFKNGTFIDVEGSKKTINCDFLVICMGFIGTKQEDLESFGIDYKGNKPSLMGFKASSKENVYVTGDMKNGQSLVVSAIKDGIDCAELIIAKHK